MSNHEARICRYCGRLTLEPVFELGSRVKSGWRCSNPECSNKGVIQHVG